MAPPYRKLMTKLSSEMGSLSPSPPPGRKERRGVEEAESSSTIGVLETAAAVNPQIMRLQRQIAAAATAAAAASTAAARAVPPPSAASSISANGNPSTIRTAPGGRDDSARAPPPIGAMQGDPRMMMMMMAMPNSMPAMSQEQKQQIQQLQRQYSAYVQQQLQQWQRQQGEQQSQQQGMIPNAARHVVSVPSSGASSPVPPGAAFPILPPPASNRKQQHKQKEKVVKAATVHAKGKRWARKTQYLAAQLHTPPFFIGKKLRSGKWTEAEETYANRIVRDFNLGALPDCKPGVTLRAYLARKLHCSPMRISKKYAGNNVGKAMYLAKGTRSLPMHAGRPGMPGAPRAPNGPAAEQGPLFALEALFYRSIDCGSGNVSGVCSSASSTAPTPSAGTSLGPSPPPPPLPFGLPADGTTCCIPPMYQQAPAIQKGIPFYPGFVQVPHAPDQNNMPQHVPSPFVAPPMLQPVQQQLFPPHLVHSSGSIEARPMPATDRSKHDHAEQNKRNVATTMQTAAPSACHHKVLHQSFLKALNAQCANNAASKDESTFPTYEQEDETNDDTVPAPKAQPAQVREGHDAHANTHIEKSGSSADIPEFLSGFEKIASASESSSQMPQCPDKAAAIPGAPPTPTFTSKSFDDMHRFLGSGIPSMPSFGFGERNAAISRLALPPGCVQEHTHALSGPATDALLEQGGNDGTNTDEADMKKEGQLEPTSEADASYEYALLAQRSVIAVMQHSAYSLKNAGNSGSSSSSTSESSAGARAKKCRIAPLASRSTVSSTSYVGGRRANVISGSERSSSELGESESMFGSSRGTSSGSDDDDLEENGSNQFDSPSVLTTRKMRISGLRSNESTPKAAELAASPDDGEVLGPSTMSERW